MSAAAAVLDAAARAGVPLRLDEAGRLKVRARPSEVPPDLLARLRAHKAELAALLAGRVCRRCGGDIVDARPDWLAFADGTAAHEVCEDCWELARLKARAENALTPEALADDAELCVRGALG